MTPWITERPPTAEDTSERHYWSVDVMDRDGSEYAMRWDDLDVQEFETGKTCVMAWRPMA